MKIEFLYEVSRSIRNGSYKPRDTSTGILFCIHAGFAWKVILTKSVRILYKNSSGVPSIHMGRIIRLTRLLRTVRLECLPAGTSQTVPQKAPHDKFGKREDISRLKCKAIYRLLESQRFKWLYFKCD